MPPGAGEKRREVNGCPTDGLVCATLFTWSRPDSHGLLRSGTVRQDYLQMPRVDLPSNPRCSL
jgi:hypothetical protein